MHLSDLLSVKIILASQSPRRLQLLKQMGFEVVTTKIEVEEKAKEGLQDFELAEHLAKKPCLHFADRKRQCVGNGRHFGVRKRATARKTLRQTAGNALPQNTERQRTPSNHGLHNQKPPPRNNIPLCCKGLFPYFEQRRDELLHRLLSTF